MLTGRPSDIFEITDEPLDGDAHEDRLPEERPQEVKAATEPAARSRALALGGLLGATVVVVMLLGRSGEETSRPARATPQAPARADIDTAPLTGSGRDERTPRAKQARRTGPVERPRRDVRERASRTTASRPASSAGDPHVVVVRAEPVQVVRESAAARPAPYEEFGFER